MHEPTEEELQEAYEEGLEASANDGITADDNPYVGDLALAKAWSEGLEGW